MEQIDIMPKTGGSGPEGTRELMSLATPILAALNFTPIGRGVTAAVATMATIPEESQAGIFAPLKRMASKGMQLVEDGASVFPDMTRNLEFNTQGFASYIAKGGSVEYIADSRILHPSTKGLKGDDMTQMLEADFTLSRVYAKQANDSTMRIVHKSSDKTNAFFQHPSERFPQGKIVVRDSATPYEQAGSTTHEFTHSLDIQDPTLKAILKRKEADLGYTENLGESRAFLAGYRASFPKSLTEPSSADFIHPMISVAGGKADIIPALDYVNNLRHSYKAIGMQVNEEELGSYLMKLVGETNRIQKKLDVDPKFAAKVAKATEETSPNNASWTLSREQKQLLKEANEDKIAQMNLRQKEIDDWNRANPQGETFTEPGYNASSDTFKEATEMGDFDAFYNPTKDFGTYNNVVKTSVKMSPQEYLDRTVKGFEGQGYKKEDILGRTEKGKLDKLRKAVEEGATLPSPSLRYAYTKGGEDAFSQEGWHRAMLAKEMGIKEMPVSVIYNETKGY